MVLLDRRDVQLLTYERKSLLTFVAVFWEGGQASHQRQCARMTSFAEELPAAKQEVGFFCSAERLNTKLTWDYGCWAQ